MKDLTMLIECFGLCGKTKRVHTEDKVTVWLCKKCVNSHEISDHDIMYASNISEELGYPYNTIEFPCGYIGCQVDTNVHQCERCALAK